MTELGKEAGTWDQWSEINARLSLSDEDKIVGWVECPICGEEHAVDDLHIAGTNVTPLMKMKMKSGGE